MAGIVKIFIDAEHASVGPGAVTCKFHLSICGKPFPERDWNDFGVITLTWWLEESMKILSKDVHQIRLYFMDGALYVRLYRTKNTALFECYHNENIVLSDTGSFSVFVESLAAGASALLDQISARGDSNKDSDLLASALAKCQLQMRREQWRS